MELPRKGADEGVDDGLMHAVEEEVDDKISADPETAIAEDGGKVVVGDNGDAEMVDDGGPAEAATRPSWRKKSDKVWHVHCGGTGGPWERYIEETGAGVECAAPSQEKLEAAGLLAQAEDYDEMFLGYEGDEFDQPAAEEGM